MGLKRTVYCFFITMVLSTIFWTIYYVTLQSIPTVFELNLIGGSKFSLPITISRLWDAVVGTVWLNGLYLLLKSEYLKKYLVQIRSLKDYIILLVIFLSLEFIYTENGELFGILTNGLIIFICAFLFIVKETKNIEASLVLGNVFISNLIGGVVFYYYGAVIGLIIAGFFFLIIQLFYYFIINLSQACKQRPIW